MTLTYGYFTLHENEIASWIIYMESINVHTDLSETGAEIETRTHSRAMWTGHKQREQESIPVGGGGRGGMSPNEQVWTGLQWSPSDITSRVGPQVWCPGGRGGEGRRPYHVIYPMMHLMWPTPYPPWTERRLQKHYLPATSFARNYMPYVLFW